jgi:hypothetical protein
MVAYAACQGRSRAYLRQVSGAGNYSHPHPQVEGASAQGQAGPHV